MKHTRMILGQIIITTPTSNLRSRSPPSNSLLLSTLSILPHTQTHNIIAGSTIQAVNESTHLFRSRLWVPTRAPQIGKYWILQIPSKLSEIVAHSCLHSFHSLEKKNTREMERGNILYIPTFHIISCHIMLCFGWSFFVPFSINHPHEPRRQKAACGIVSYSETIKKTTKRIKLTCAYSMNQNKRGKTHQHTWRSNTQML